MPRVAQNAIQRGFTLYGEDLARSGTFPLSQKCNTLVLVNGLLNIALSAF